MTKRATINPNNIKDSAAPIDAENPSDLTSRPSATNDGNKIFRGFLDTDETPPAIA
jgi:hypothetical protein